MSTFNGIQLPDGTVYTPAGGSGGGLTIATEYDHTVSGSAVTSMYIVQTS